MERIDRKIAEIRELQAESDRRTEAENRSEELIGQYRFDEAVDPLGMLEGAEGMAGQDEAVLGYGQRQAEADYRAEAMNQFAGLISQGRPYKAMGLWKKESGMAWKGRRTTDEGAIRKKVAKMRGMEDAELVHYVEDRVEKARSEGFREGARLTEDREIMDSKLGWCLATFVASYDRSLLLLKRIGRDTDGFKAVMDIASLHVAQWIAWRDVLEQIDGRKYIFVHRDGYFGIYAEDGNERRWLLKVERKERGDGEGKH